jgi:hypothetical protein
MPKHDFMHDVYHQRPRKKLPMPSQRRVKLADEMCRQMQELKLEEDTEVKAVLKAWDEVDRFNVVLLKKIEDVYREKKVFDKYWKLDTKEPNL